jgi:RimJ/RimL family protein N-acetyltransferase
MLEKPKLRLLRREELHRLRSFYRKNGSPIDPHKQLLTAAVAELSDSTIVGFCGFELIPHAGPIEIVESYRGNGLGIELFQTIEKELDKYPHTGYYTFPSNDASKKLVEKLGLIKLEDWEVWKREY